MIGFFYFVEKQYGEYLAANLGGSITTERTLIKTLSLPSPLNLKYKWRSPLT